MNQSVLQPFRQEASAALCLCGSNGVNEHELAIHASPAKMSHHALQITSMDL